MKKEVFNIQGMSCAACASRVQKAVFGLKGVDEVSVNLLKNSMTVIFDASENSADQIVSAVKKAGYGASLQKKTLISNTSSEARADLGNLQQRQLKRQLVVSVIFALPLLCLSMGTMAEWAPSIGAQTALSAIGPAAAQLLLTLPVVVVNRRYFYAGFKALFARAATMDSLIALGSGAAVLSGLYALCQMAIAYKTSDGAALAHWSKNLYFESAAVILTLITFGRFLESKAKGKTSEAIAKLVNLAPKTATVIRGGKEVSLPVEQILVGDILVVKAGAHVPVDGVIVEGDGLVDEASLTGESIPAEKKEGDRVISATTNLAGHFLMRALKVGDDTTLAQIIRLVDEATSSKAPIAKLADKISGIFVPVVITIALAATVIWLLLGYDMPFALSIGIAVLVISCPCALGLATPTAIMVGTGKGASLGILLKSARSIETAGKVDTIVLDKTGTLTEGKPTVVEIMPAEGVSEEALLEIAASLEKRSEHPLGVAIVREAERRGLKPSKTVSQFAQISGQGISGVIDGTPCFLGNARMLRQRGVRNPYADTEKRFCLAGRTPLYCIKGAQLLGVFILADRIKPDSRQAVDAFKRMGMQVVMLTGDNACTAEEVRRQAGIDRVFSELLPADKEQKIRDMQARGQCVAMIGDGINDAPALARADVGLAIGAGTDIAIESADIVLMKNSLLDAVAAIQLSRAVMRNIRQNLFWAFFYNSASIPIAAGLFYGLCKLTLNPMIAAAAMSFSSVSVVANALRLRFFKPESFSQNSEKKPKYPPMEKTITVEGMHCVHCAACVEKALCAVEGVKAASVNLAGKTAIVSLERDVPDIRLKKAVEEAGFKAIRIR